MSVVAIHFQYHFPYFLSVRLQRLRRSWRLAGSGGTKTVSFTNPPIRKSRTGLNPGNGVTTALTRHL